MPNELTALNNNLKIRIEKNLYKGEGITNEEVNKILESIQKTIDAKVADYAENEIDIDIDKEFLISLKTLKSKVI